MPASQATCCRMQEMRTSSGCAPPYIQSGILKSLENPSFLSRDAFPSSMVPEKDTNPRTPSGLQQWTCHPAEQERRGGFVLDLPCLVAFPTRTTQHPLRATSPSDSRGQRFPQQTHPGARLFPRPRSLCSPGSPQPAGAWCLGDGRELCPRWSWQPLWLEIAVRCKRSHLPVFAPYHFQRIYALETIGTLLAVCQVQALFILNISEYWGWGKQLKEAHHKRHYLRGLNFPQVLIFQLIFLTMSVWGNNWPSPSGSGS